ncbi:NlpC/P60 family protein [Stackebrandtia nassauensis]|uniref:NLP/P60 protein n=1 Tax=Stackebrandtia nassauensis (strain DSM 44728 / CIP 108903 / NRRL B-16338 / NBRC 102104 / LLR-40K-21) TaxID=446470 RepID=D3PZ79_STANL|nr:C40 family peptidase [Stackebrandtia nassauensis]ADD45508.1 NLP/P60 protein [Stackebrandtia nassauensis DSM 44728]
MKKRYAVIAAVAAAVLCVVITPATASAEPDTLEEVEDELDKKGNEMEKLAEKYNGAREDLKKTEKKIKKIKKQLPKYEKEAEESRKILSDIAYEEYTGGSQLVVAGSALAENPQEAMKRISVLGAINASQGAEISANSSTLKDLLEKKQDLEDLKDEQKKTKSDLKKKKKKLDGQIGELKELREKLGGGGDTGGSGPPPPSGRAGEVVQYAYDQLGDPYGYGQAGPDSFDCSGLTLAAWQQAGVSLYHKASVQREETASVSRSDLAPGDLVFYYSDLHHVALYVGDGKVVHAPQSGDVVKVANMNDMPVHSYGRP